MNPNETTDPTNPTNLTQTAFHGQPAEALPAIRHLRQLLKQAEFEHVMTLRRHGATWRHIAKLLNLSHQQTHKIYAPWEPTQT